MSLKRKFYFIIFFSLGLINSPSFSIKPASVFYLMTYTNHNPLVLDAKDSFTFPRRFRTTLTPIPSKKLAHYLKSRGKLPSLKGYQALNASGSAQFSRKNILAALSSMQGQVYIVDLRKESHGFINGEAISWYGKRNWANKGQTDSFLSHLETRLFQRLINLKKTSICHLPKGSSSNLCNINSISTSIETAKTEKQLLNDLGLKYIRFPVLDRWRPNDAIIDQFVKFVKSLPARVWLHFHCRGGSGRTTTFLVMYDIIRNAQHVTLNDIIARHALAGVKDLKKIPYVMFEEWQTTGALERLAVIEKFYEYVRDSEGYSSRSWTEWLNLKKVEFTSPKF